MWSPGEWRGVGWQKGLAGCSGDREPVDGSNGCAARCSRAKDRAKDHRSRPQAGIGRIRHTQVCKLAMMHLMSIHGQQLHLHRLSVSSIPSTCSDPAMLVLVEGLVNARGQTLAITRPLLEPAQRCQSNFGAFCCHASCSQFVTVVMAVASMGT